MGEHCDNETKQNKTTHDDNAREHEHEHEGRRISINMARYNKADAHTGRHEEVNKKALENKKGRKKMDVMADRRGLDSGKNDLKDELKRATGKSASQLGIT